jgi:hypothetical protein
MGVNLIKRDSDPGLKKITRHLIDLENLKRSDWTFVFQKYLSLHF